MMVDLSFGMFSISVASISFLLSGLSLSAIPWLTTWSIAPSLSSERILGMQPLTFLCVAIPVVIQVVILLIWAIKWRSPE
ncbi:MAG: hypothetical protein ACP5KV_03640 [Candidatus Methanomethylicaceae archaeon]